MKKSSFIILLICCMIALVWSCSKDTELVAPTSPANTQAFIKIAHYAPNLRGVLNNRDSFNVYVNNVKLNGGFLTFGSLFPSTSNLYAAVPAGAQSIRITVNGVTTPDSVTMATFTKTLTAGSYYSFILTDSLMNTSEAKQIFVQDNFTISDTLQYTIRFVHAILNDTLGKNVDIYSTRKAANMFSNVSPGTVTTFTSQPYSLLTDTLIVRRAGGTYELARINAAVLARQRAYTLVYKGLTTSTTGTKARSLSTYVNQ